MTSSQVGELACTGIMIKPGRWLSKGTLEHIRQVLDIRDGGEPPCVHVTGLINRRLAEVEARLAELARARDQLAALAGRAAAQDPADCYGCCSIIAS